MKKTNAMTIEKVLEKLKIDEKKDKIDKKYLMETYKDYVKVY